MKVNPFFWQGILNKKHFLLCIWLLWAGVYLFTIIPYLQKPILGWETVTWQEAKDIAIKGPQAVRIFSFTPFYTCLIAFCFKIFGINELSARLAGIASFISTPIIIYFLIKEITDKRDHLLTALCAGALFVTSPAAIQGSLVIDRADTTVFMLVVCLFYLFLFKTESYSFKYRVILLGSLYSLCLLAKSTTALACLIAVPAAYFLKGEFKNGLKLSAGVFMFGGILFLAIWVVFCYYIVGLNRFYEPFAYCASSASITLLTFKAAVFKKAVLDSFRTILWFSPFLLILGAQAAFDILKPFFRHLKPDKEIQLVTFIAVVFLFYIYANAVFSGFPKYIIPVLPMLCCITAKFTCKRINNLLSKRNAFILLLFLCFSIGYCFIFVGDWVYQIYLLRQAQAQGALASVFLGLICQQALYYCLPILIFLISVYFIPASLSERLIFVLLVCLIASNISLSIIQRRAKYCVNYAYGTEGAEELRGFLRQSPALKAATSVEGYMANVNRVEFVHIATDAWNSPKNFLALIRENPPECLIYGLALNTAAQLKQTLADPEVVSSLRRYYHGVKIGSYNVLLKRKITQ